MSARPKDFDCGRYPPDEGPGWEIAGEVFPTNPAHDLPIEYMDIVRLWRLYSAGFGSGHLPDDGGVNDQSCWLLDAFNIMTKYEQDLTRSP